MTDAEERVLRTITALLGVASVVFGLLTLSEVAEQASRAPAPWTAVALVTLVGMPTVLGATAPWIAPRHLRRGAAITGIAALVTLASVPIANADRPPTAPAPWALQLTALGTTSMSVSAPLAFVALDVIVTAALVTADRLLTASGDLLLTAVQDGLYDLLFGGVFAALAVGALRAARSVDSAADMAIEATARAQQEQVRASERARVNGLVHDHVLTTLLVASRSPEASVAAAHSAAAALARLGQLTQPVDALTTWEAAQVVDRLRALTTDIAPTATFTVEQQGGLVVPIPVAEATAGALGEALRNSRRHAGQDARIEVHVMVGTGGIDVAVVDDGIGFDLGAVPANRLGIAVSVVSRMHSVQGRGEVRSLPGRGTAVRIVWSA